MHRVSIVVPGVVAPSGEPRDAQWLLSAMTVVFGYVFSRVPVPKKDTDMPMAVHVVTLAPDALVRAERCCWAVEPALTSLRPQCVQTEILALQAEELRARILGNNGNAMRYESYEAQLSAKLVHVTATAATAMAVLEHLFTAVFDAALDNPRQLSKVEQPPLHLTPVLAGFDPDEFTQFVNLWLGVRAAGAASGFKRLETTVAWQSFASRYPPKCALDSVVVPRAAILAGRAFAGNVTI